MSDTPSLTPPPPEHDPLAPTGLMVGAAVVNATLWDRKLRGRLGESGSMQA